jgi:aspartyl/asparaginyl beta-hydroxylase (cupin superfamily)
MSTAFFSILAPGKVLPPHRGPYNGVLRYHLGLRIPASDETCAIRVGDQTRTWAEGQALVFDDTYPHEAWDRTPEWRIVLFVDFLRPLPLLPRLVNAAMMALIRRTRFVQVAAKNQKQWETSFYG